MSSQRISLKDRTFNQIKTLCGYANFCSYTDKDLSQMLGTSERHLKRILRSLEDEGRIFRTKIWIGNFEYDGHEFRCPKFGRRIYWQHDLFLKDVDSLHWQEKFYHKDKTKKAKLKEKIHRDIIKSASQCQNESTQGHQKDPKPPKSIGKHIRTHIHVRRKLNPREINTTEERAALDVVFSKIKKETGLTLGDERMPSENVIKKYLPHYKLEDIVRAILVVRDVAEKPADPDPYFVSALKNKWHPKSESYPYKKEIECLSALFKVIEKTGIYPGHLGVNREKIYIDDPFSPQHYEYNFDDEEIEFKLRNAFRRLYFECKKRGMALEEEFEASTI